MMRRRGVDTEARARNALCSSVHSFYFYDCGVSVTRMSDHQSRKDCFEESFERVRTVKMLCFGIDGASPINVALFFPRLDVTSYGILDDAQLAVISFMGSSRMY
jgi:hypothetical protein